MFKILHLGSKLFERFNKNPNESNDAREKIRTGAGCTIRKLMTQENHLAFLHFISPSFSSACAKDHREIERREHRPASCLHIYVFII